MWAILCPAECALLFPALLRAVLKAIVASLCPARMWEAGFAGAGAGEVLLASLRGAGQGGSLPSSPSKVVGPPDLPHLREGLVAGLLPGQSEVVLLGVLRPSSWVADGVGAERLAMGEP